MENTMEEMRIIVKGIVKYQDKYLLIQKWYDDRIDEPYQWEFIDGKINEGESPDDAVREIVFENTSLEVKPEKILYTWDYEVGKTAYVGLAFLCTAENDMVILSEDLNGYMWVTTEEFKDYIQNPRILNDINKVFKID